jgi:hypothetical protein
MVLIQESSKLNVSGHITEVAIHDKITGTTNLYDLIRGDYNIVICPFIIYVNAFKDSIHD